MAGDVRRSEGTPPDRLGRIARTMLMVMEHHAENFADSVRGIVLLLDGEEANAATLGWDDPDELLAAVLQYAEALAKANGLPFSVMQMPADPGGQG